MSDRIQAAVDFIDVLGSQYNIDWVTECWNYNGKVGSGKNQRPTTLMGTKGTTTGRVICTIVNGPAPPNHQAAHSCDNGMCISPYHFQWRHSDVNQFQNATGLPKGIRHRGTNFEAHIKRNGKHHYKSFYNIQEAVNWLESIRCNS